MLHVLLTHLPPRCALTFFPAPEGQAVKRLRTPPSKVLKEQRFFSGKKGVRINYKLKKIPEGQEYAPRLEPAAPIRLAGQSNAHCPSRHRTILKKRWLNDGLPAHAIRSTRQSSEDVTRTLDALPSKVRSDIFPRSRRASSQMLENTSLQGAQRTKIFSRKKGVRINYMFKKSPKGKSTRRDSNPRHRFA